MPTPSREDIYQALFALLKPLLAPGGLQSPFPPDDLATITPTSDQPFRCVTREVIEVQRVPPGLQPVLQMYEMNEVFEDDGPGLTPQSLQVILIFGATSPKGTPGQTILNPLIDAVIDALEPPDGMEMQQLLFENDDGEDEPLVEWVRIKGVAGKDHGNNSTDPETRQASYYLPLEIRLPSP